MPFNMRLLVVEMLLEDNDNDNDNHQAIVDDNNHAIDDAITGGGDAACRSQDQREPLQPGRWAHGSIFFLLTFQAKIVLEFIVCLYYFV